MNFNEVASNMVENFVLRWPEIVTFLLIILYYLKDFKKKYNSFPEVVSGFQTKVSNDFSLAKNDIEKVTKNAINSIEKVVDRHLEVMKEMSQKVEKYQSLIEELKLENNAHLVLSASVLQVLIDVLGKDNEMIKEGLSTDLIPKLENMIIKIQEKPNNHLEHLPIIEESLKAIMYMLGEHNFEKLLKKVGYEYGEQEAKS